MKKKNLGNGEIHRGEDSLETVDGGGEKHAVLDEKNQSKKRKKKPGGGGGWSKRNKKGLSGECKN